MKYSLILLLPLLTISSSIFCADKQTIVSVEEHDYLAELGNICRLIETTQQNPEKQKELLEDLTKNKITTYLLSGMITAKSKVDPNLAEILFGDFVPADSPLHNTLIVRIADGYLKNNMTDEALNFCYNTFPINKYASLKMAEIYTNSDCKNAEAAIYWIEKYKIHAPLAETAQKALTELYDQAQKPRVHFNSDGRVELIRPGNIKQAFESVMQFDKNDSDNPGHLSSMEDI